MSGLSRKRYLIGVGAYVFLYWATALALPFMIVAPDHTRLGVSGWCVVVAVIGYGAYTGLRAFARGWKARFILRIVVPTALFVTSSIVVAAL